MVFCNIFVSYAVRHRCKNEGHRRARKLYQRTQFKVAVTWHPFKQHHRFTENLLDASSHWSLQKRAWPIAYLVEHAHTIKTSKTFCKAKDNKKVRKSNQWNDVSCQARKRILALLDIHCERRIDESLTRNESRTPCYKTKNVRLNKFVTRHATKNRCMSLAINDDTTSTLATLT